MFFNFRHINMREGAKTDPCLEKFVNKSVFFQISQLLHSDEISFVSIRSKMSSNDLKCNACGSTDIDVDPSRADAVCTNCGNVLEQNRIVSDIQFEENAHGGSSAIGTFVSSESKGGGTFSFGGGGGGRGFGNFSGGLVRESREITLKNARRKIEALAHQLSLRRDRIDMAFHFFKLGWHFILSLS